MGMAEKREKWVSLSSGHTLPGGEAKVFLFILSLPAPSREVYKCNLNACNVWIKLHQEMPAFPTVSHSHTQKYLIWISLKSYLFPFCAVKRFFYKWKALRSKNCNATHAKMWLMAKISNPTTERKAREAIEKSSQEAQRGYGMEFWQSFLGQRTSSKKQQSDQLQPHWRKHSELPPTQSVRWMP